MLGPARLLHVSPSLLQRLRLHHGRRRQTLPSGWLYLPRGMHACMSSTSFNQSLGSIYDYTFPGVGNQWPDPGKYSSNLLLRVTSAYIFERLILMAGSSGRQQVDAPGCVLLREDPERHSLPGRRSAGLDLPILPAYRYNYRNELGLRPGAQRYFEQQLKPDMFWPIAHFYFG